MLNSVFIISKLSKKASQDDVISSVFIKLYIYKYLTEN